MTINSYIKNKIKNILKEYEEFDLDAPWKQDDYDPNEIVDYSIDYNTETIDVEKKESSFEVEFIDFIEEYWKLNPNTFEHSQEKLEEESFYKEFIKNALSDKEKFLATLYSLSERNDFFRR